MEERRGDRAVDLAAVRRVRERHGLDRDDLDPDPVEQFRRWYDDAVDAGLHQPEAMVLVSARRSGDPSARMVLLRGFDHDGFVFYTNYGSRKAQELEANPSAALLFPWHAVSRQVRIAGRVERTSPAVSDAYFASRPRGSQLSAWASPQSDVVADREALEALRIEQEERWGDREVTRPPFWGGYRLVLRELELWQGRENRYHDRFRYRRADPGGSAWVIERLAP